MNMAKINTKKLIEEVKCLYSAIFQADCFGANDVLFYEKICRELERRGYCQAWNEVWISKKQPWQKKFGLEEGQA
jgi:hypothetical protein